MKFESAAVIAPSNLFLKGENDLSEHLKNIAECLKCTGFQLKKVSVVEESDQSVAYELNLLSKFYDIVIVLFNEKSQCVNYALQSITGQELVKFSDIEYFPNSYSMNALWPKSTKLLKTEHTISPIIYLQRIFIVSCDACTDQLNFILKGHLQHYQCSIQYEKMFRVTLNGSKKHLEDIKSEKLCITYRKAMTGIAEQDALLTLTAKDFDSIVSGEIILKNTLGPDLLSSFWVNHMSDLIYQSGDKHIKHSIDVIEKCFEVYGVDNVFLSFNGGKDCTVLLHLIQTVLHKKYPSDKDKRKLFCLYVRSDNAFKEQDEFIEQCMVYYNLEVMSVTTNIKDALQITINRKPHFKACFMGTRRTDPFCSHMSDFQMTDGDWPEIMRCSPFLDWHYSDIWDYLLYYKVPYCKLYDYGFTSLGNAINTIRNPNLLFNDGDKEVYLPAYKLFNEQKERSGRNISKI